MTSDLHRSDSAASWASENGAAPDDTAELLPLIDDGEIRDVEAAFSDMIDRTCSNGPAADGNIFEHTLVPGDWCGFIFRSMVPSHETVKQHFKHELPQQFFNYDGTEGVKYAFKVLDRRTNRLTYEQMPSYHKYGMRLLFSGPVQREILHTRAIQKFFARETKRIGEAFDDGKSRKHIPAFVKMYQIDLNQLLLTRIDEYASFNEFFYRKLKPDARPIASPDDPNVVVSAADCRLMVFDNINDATRIWIKGHHFSLARLFDDEKMAEEFDGGSIAVFRLAPVDYHRYHSPVNAKIGPKMKKITGTYYTVNPIAIKENLDVLTRNQRTVITLESDAFESVAFVSIGALLVGSVNFTVQPHENVRKGDEVGYFAYGGSTIVVVFRAGLVKWDNDVQHNSNNSMETLVRMGERIGQRRTSEERQEYLEYFAKHGGRNATIKQLLNYFPNVPKAT